MWTLGFLPMTVLLGLLARAEAQANDVPVLPSRDGFYTWNGTTDWTDDDLGRILDSRRVQINFSAVPDAVLEYNAFQLLYVTQNLDKEKVTSVTTIVVPGGANTSQILSYQIAYDSPDINCSPSYGLQPGANVESGPVTRGQMNLIAKILEDAHPPVLNIPDYEGSNAAFTVGPQSAYQTLDSIRAATASGDITGVDENAEIALFGYSGGAYASEWAVEFHSEYASNVNIIGAALGGVPTNIMKTYRNVNMVFPALDVWAMLGVMNAIPEINAYMEGDLKPEHQDQFLRRRERCSNPEIPLPAIPALANISSWFEHGADFLTIFESELTEIGVLGNHISTERPPTFPIYLFQGGLDVVTRPYDDTVALKDKFCEAGTSVFLYKWPLLDHILTSFAGSPYAMNWIKKVFNREEIQNSCDGTFGENLTGDVLGRFSDDVS